MEGILPTRMGYCFFPFILDAIFFQMAPNHFLPHFEVEYISRGGSGHFNKRVLHGQYTLLP